MAWLFLVVAGLFEVVWSLGLKLTEGFTRPLPTAVTLVALVTSLLLLAHAVRTLPVGTAYAVWVGIGAAGAALGGHFLLAEPMPPARLAFLTLLIVSIVGLKLTAPPA